MAISDALRVVASSLADALVGSAVDRAEEEASGFGLRYPRTLRIARIVGGAFLALAGAWETGGTIVLFIWVVINEGVPDRPVCAAPTARDGHRIALLGIPADRSRIVQHGRILREPAREIPV
jgi:hypothetical protein